MRLKVRVRRIVKWTFTLLCALLSVAWLISHEQLIRWSSAGGYYNVDLTNGTVSFQWPTAFGRSSNAPRPGLSEFSVRRVCAYEWTGRWVEITGNAWCNAISARLPFLCSVTAIAAATLWFRDRRQVRDTFERLRMNTRSPTRLRLFRGLVLLSTVIVLLLLISLSWSFVLVGESQTLMLASGSVTWSALGTSTNLGLAGGLPLSTGIHSNRTLVPKFTPRFLTMPGNPLPRIQLISIPLWIPLLVVLIPVLVLAWYGRHPLPGYCARCGYDSTGNVSNVCPECGAKLDAEKFVEPDRWSV